MGGSASGSGLSRREVPALAVSPGEAGSCGAELAGHGHSGEDAAGSPGGPELLRWDADG